MVSDDIGIGAIMNNGACMRRETRVKLIKGGRIKNMRDMDKGIDHSETRRDKATV